MDAPDPEACIDAVGDLAPRLLRTLAMLEFAGRHLHPANIDAIARELGPLATELSASVERFGAIAWPETAVAVRDAMASSATLAAGACEGLRIDRAEDFVQAFRALRRGARATETLYPLAALLPPVSRFFLERELDEGVANDLLARLEREAEAPRRDRGVFHVDNERDQRGGHSVYVPEWVADDVPMPLVVALHGGSGHGRDFLYSWLREARTRGCVVLAPTSPDRTWSFTELSERGDVDHEHLFSLVVQLGEALPIDAERMLLTGMSDGGSYTLMSGLREASPFTALAPFSCVLSPEVLMDGRIHNARDLPIRYVHGALDWMFDPSMAREAVRTLEAAGAQVEYHEIDDLSHTYARDQNGAVLDWFGVPVPGASAGAVQTD